MPKSFIHPNWYSDSKVFCDDLYLFCIGSTKPKLRIDYWSSSYHFYIDFGSLFPVIRRIERFNIRYGHLSNFAI